MASSRQSRFWKYQALFWSLAGVGLFLSGVSQTTVRAALVRNIFLVVAGFLASFFLAALLERLRALSGARLRLAVYPTLYVLATLCVVGVNAITFVQWGVAWSEMTWGQWLSGTLNFALVLALWVELYIHQVARWATRPQPSPEDPLAPVEEEAASEPDASGRLTVEHRGSFVPLDPADVSHVVAAGDYVEIHTADRVYLERRTMQAMTELLKGRDFLRVHRSHLVNCGHVEAVTPISKGRYRLALRQGDAVESSRSYRRHVQDRLLSA